MDLIQGLSIYFVITLITIVILYRMGRTFVGSLVLGLIVGQISLNFIKSLITLPAEPINTELLFYYTIQYLTPILCLIFLIRYAYRDIRLF